MAAGHTEITTIIEEETVMLTAGRLSVLPATDAGITEMICEDILREEFSLIFQGFINLPLTFGL